MRSWQSLRMPPVSEDLAFRGLVHQVSDDKVLALLDAGALTAYAGFDPTADSLHVGHLVGILTLRRLQLAGNRPILLAGGGTGMVGDPGGKSTERPLLSRDELEAYVTAIRAQLGRFLDLYRRPAGRRACCSTTRPGCPAGACSSSCAMSASTSP